MDENIANSSDIPIIISNMTPLIDSFCIKMLYEEINVNSNASIRFWDLFLLVPAALFSLFLLANCKSVVRCLHSTSSPLITTFFIMVCVVDVVKVIRAVVSMSVNSSDIAGEKADKVLWLILRFFLLATEMSVIVFGIAAAHLDSRSSVRRVILVTSLIAFTYSLIQGILELNKPDKHFHIDSLNCDLFGHGGVIFLLSTSTFFLFVYSTILVLPLTKIRRRLHLPSRLSFYIYCGLLAILYFVQAVGSLLFLSNIIQGLCVINFTTFIYFCLFDPLVYIIFLQSYFSPQTGRLGFIYRLHYDDSGSINTSVGNINDSDGIVRAANGEAFSTEGRPSQGEIFFASTHFNADSPVPQDWALNTGLLDSCDAECDYFSGQSHGKNPRSSAVPPSLFNPSLMGSGSGYGQQQLDITNSQNST